MILCAVIADLTSAYELRKTDYESVILEAGTRPCGHSGTIRDGARETDLNGHISEPGRPAATRRSSGSWSLQRELPGRRCERSGLAAGQL